MLKEKLFFLRDYFDAKPYEVPVFRFWAIIVGFFLPIYGVLLTNVDLQAIDYVSHRLIFTIAWFSLFIASYLSESIKKKIILLAYIGNLAMMSWIIWIVQINQFSPNYSIGLFLCLCMGIIFRNYKEMIVFYLIILFILLSAINSVSILNVNKYVLGLSVLIIIAVYLIVMFQRNHINRNLVRANEELIIKNKELEQFVYIASHDLKTPLRTIGSFASLLKRRINSSDKEAMKEYATYILNGSIRMTRILDDLSEYAEIGKTKPNFELVNIQDIVDTVIRELRHEASNSTIDIAIPHKLPQKVVAHYTQTIQIFQNIIENGIKYNRSENKKIVISYTETKSHWSFTIQDNGIGISDEFHKQIFEIFKRLHTTEEFKGTGIGLAICKRIVEIHKGSISIDSEEGKGTSIQFTISKNLG